MVKIIGGTFSGFIWSIFGSGRNEWMNLVGFGIILQSGRIHSGVFEVSNLDS